MFWRALHVWQSTASIPDGAFGFETAAMMTPMSAASSRDVGACRRVELESVQVSRPRPEWL
jgi:hypothetical protein